jgi:CheY-like chemotaxis protein
MQDSNPNLTQVQPFQHTLLQIEDNQANALLVEMMLAERSDLKLLTAINGYQGISMASSHKPDIILMDINMPDIGGLAALKILRENPAIVKVCQTPALRRRTVRMQQTLAGRRQRSLREETAGYTGAY